MERKIKTRPVIYGLILLLSIVKISVTDNLLENVSETIGLKTNMCGHYFVFDIFSSTNATLMPPVGDQSSDNYRFGQSYYPTFLSSFEFSSNVKLSSSSETILILSALFLFLFRKLLVTRWYNHNHFKFWIYWRFNKVQYRHFTPERYENEVKGFYVEQKILSIILFLMIETRRFKRGLKTTQQPGEEKKISKSSSSNVSPAMMLLFAKSVQAVRVEVIEELISQEGKLFGRPWTCMVMQEPVLITRIEQLMKRFFDEQAIKEVENKFPKGAWKKVSPAKKLLGNKGSQGEGVEVIEVLTENAEDSAQKTFPLILPPPLMCSLHGMIKAAKAALAVWKLDTGQTYINEQSVCKEQLAKAMGQVEVSLFVSQIQNLNHVVGIHNNRKDGDMVQNFQSVTQFGGLELASRPNFNLVPKAYATGPKIATSLRPMNAREHDPHCSIQEHCTVTHLSTNLSSVQRKYVGLWRPNKRCYWG